jgi:hypothetical protein
MSGVEVLHVAAVPDRGPAVFAVTTATSVLASVFVAGRMYSRIKIVRRVSADDYIMCLAWLFAFFMSMTIELGTTRGLGRHDADIPNHKRPGLRKCEYVFSVLYVCTSSWLFMHVVRLAYGFDRIRLSWRQRLPSWSSIFACPRIPRRSFAWLPGRHSESSTWPGWC